jgi:hypothetical protein
VPALLLLLVLLLLIRPLPASATAIFLPPHLTSEETGARIESVAIETYGVIDPAVVRQYLSLQRGDRLDQESVDHDFNNLKRLGGFGPRLQIQLAGAPHTVRLVWIVQSKFIKPTTHPFYGDAPLSAPIQGVGWIITSPPVDPQGGSFSSYTQFSRRANLARVLFTQPLTVNPVSGTQSSFVADEFGGRGVYRASQPEAINVYSWTTGQEMLWLNQATNGTQVETGVRLIRSTDELPSAVTATSLWSTFKAPAHNTELSAGVSHGCLTGPDRWYPPFCDQQYRFSVTDAIGGMGATDEFHIVTGDYVRYFSVGESTFLLHGTMARSGGVLPDSFLTCAIARSYPKSFCGTDAQGLNAEFRIDDHLTSPWQFALFTEEASSRVRGSEVPFATTYFTWHPDSGIGITYRMVRINIAYGSDGGRIEGELKGAYY